MPDLSLKSGKRDKDLSTSKFAKGFFNMGVLPYGGLLPVVLAVYLNSEKTDANFVKTFTILACQKILGAYIGRPLKIGNKHSKRRKRNVEIV